jgi:hypothetical protein
MLAMFGKNWAFLLVLNSPHPDVKSKTIKPDQLSPIENFSANLPVKFAPHCVRNFGASQKRVFGLALAFAAQAVARAD